MTIKLAVLKSTGQTVTILSTDGDATLVRYANGRQAWVSTDLVQEL